MSETAAIASRPSTRGEPHAYEFVSISAYVRANNPTAEVTRPGRSSRCSREVSLVSSTNSLAATIASRPTGMLTKKIQFQPMRSVRIPPTIGPIASESAETPAQMPIAVPRCRSGKVAVMIDSVAGFISAAPTPCTLRAAISEPALPARPHHREAAVKITSPAMKMRRRPSRSASLPPLRSRTPKVSA